MSVFLFAMQKAFGVFTGNSNIYYSKTENQQKLCSHHSHSCNNEWQRILLREHESFSFLLDKTNNVSIQRKNSGSGQATNREHETSCKLLGRKNISLKGNQLSGKLSRVTKSCTC